MRAAEARIRFAALLAASGAAAIGLAPGSAFLGSLAAPHAWVAKVGPDRAVVQLVGAAIWLVACWVTLTLVACLLARLPGAAGSCARRFGVVALPRCLRPALVVAAGAGILLGPAVAEAAGVAPTPTAAHSMLTPSPGWPTDDPVPTPAWPTHHPHPTHPAPDRSTPKPTRAAPTTAPTPTAPGKPITRTAVTVRPGDSLWSIAAAHLNATAPAQPSAAQVARAWPAWFAANRRAIGDDPNLIRPGEHLRVPGTTSTSSAQEDNHDQRVRRAAGHQLDHHPPRGRHHRGAAGAAS